MCAASWRFMSPAVHPIGPANENGIAPAALFVAAVGLALSAIPGQPWSLVFLWLCIAGFGALLLDPAVLGIADSDADRVGRRRRGRHH